MLFAICYLNHCSNGRHLLAHFYLKVNTFEYITSKMSPMGNNINKRLIAYYNFYDFHVHYLIHISLFRCADIPLGCSLKHFIKASESSSVTNLDYLIVSAMVWNGDRGLKAKTDTKPCWLSDLSHFITNEPTLCYTAGFYLNNSHQSQSYAFLS